MSAMFRKGEAPSGAEGNLCIAERSQFEQSEKCELCDLKGVPLHTKGDEVLYSLYNVLLHPHSHIFLSGSRHPSYKLSFLVVLM